MRIFKRSLIVIVLLSIVIVVSVSWYLSSMILYPGGECRKEHFIYCSDPSEAGLNFENVTFTTSDNIVLNGWYIPFQDSKKTIIFVHGHGGSIKEGLRFASSLHEAGFNLLAFDQRIYTPGDHAFASMGYHEVKDVVAAIDFVIDEKNSRSVALFGFSMGAATSIMAMEKDSRPVAAIFSSPYANVIDEMKEVGKRDYGIPEFPIFDLTEFLVNLRGNMVLQDIVPENVIADISPRPVFLMHCDEDGYIDVSHSYRLYKAAKEPKTHWIAKCDRHERIWNANPKEAERRVVDFFVKNLY